MSIETNCSLLINKYKKRKSTLDPVQKKLGQLNSLTAATNPFSDIQRKVNQPPHIAPTLASCSARHKNGGPTDVHCPQGFSKVIWEYKAFGTRGSTPHGRALEWKLQILSLLITLKQNECHPPFQSCKGHASVNDPSHMISKKASVDPSTGNVQMRCPSFILSVPHHSRVSRGREYNPS